MSNRTIKIDGVATVVSLGEKTIAITEHQLILVLTGLPKGNNFVTIVATTEPKMRKTGNPLFGKVFKTSRVNGSIQFDYENNVNAQKMREGQTPDFKAQAPVWGTRVGDSCLILHNSNFYFYVRIIKSLGYAYHTADGKPIDATEVTPYLYERKASATQELDKEIIVRKYALANIREITINGTHYQIM